MFRGVCRLLQRCLRVVFSDRCGHLWQIQGSFAECEIEDQVSECTFRVEVCSWCGVSRLVFSDGRVWYPGSGMSAEAVSSLGRDRLPAPRT